MSSRIPPLLEPYLKLPPEASLIVLTGVLGASTNWLILRFLHTALIGTELPSLGPPQDNGKVLLVSFMRDLAFWKENAKRIGLDLDKYTGKKRFSFVDGLGGLFLPALPKSTDAEEILSRPDIPAVYENIRRAIKDLKGEEGSSSVLLVIDQLDLLLAAGGEQVSVIKLEEMLMGLREEVEATVLSLAADYPLVSSNQTALERGHAALVISIAHQADFTMSLRLLDTGAARDVSGVVRITTGQKGTEDNPDIRKRIEERELLYFVSGDGGVKVFERGQ